MLTIAQMLRTWTVDWNGSPMVDGEPPRYGLHCKELRDAADELDRLNSQLVKAKEIAISSIKKCDEYARFHHRATAWHNDPDCYDLREHTIKPALKALSALTDETGDTK